VHLYDPHAPYAAPGRPAGKGRDDYLAEVRYADAQLGRLLDGVAARARGDVLVVVLSDHGEGLGEHGEETHGQLLHEATMHIPLVMAWLRGGAGFPRAGEVRTDVVSLLDVAPTVAELLGLPPLPDVDGASVVTPRPGRALPLEARAPWVYYGFSPLVGVRRDAVKLVGAPEARPAGWLRFDLRADPGETAGVPADEDPLRAAAPDAHPAQEAPVAMDEAALRAIGYMAARPPPRSAGPHDDPRTRTELIAALNAANTDIVEGRAQQALERLPAEGSPDADVPEVQLQRGRALRALGRMDEAAESLRRAVAARPGPELLAELGTILLSRDQARGGDGSEAAAALDLALDQAPGDPHLLALRGLCELLAGDAGAALRRVQPALAGAPKHGELLLVQLRALRALQADDRAAAAALRAVWPDCPDLD
jgi:tetratricopeptide (TPR) repeat protein